MKNIKISYGFKDLNLIGYSNSNYINNKADRKFISNNIFILIKRAVNW
jgi:hypothetical protein